MEAIEIVEEVAMNSQDYDLFHLGVSGGKDSTAVLLWLVHESGFPKEQLKVTFCDTGNEDSLTYAYLNMLHDRVFPIETIYPDRDFWELAKWKKRFPSRKARFCTQWLKIIPSREYLLKLLRENKKVLAMNGVRMGEAKAGNNRGDVPEFGFDEGMGCDVFRPILNWDMTQVWSIQKKYLKLEWVLELIEHDTKMQNAHKEYLIEKMKRTGIPRNPLYDMGASRVGCFPCINSRKLEVRAMSRYRPERIDFIEQQEKDFENINGYSTFFAKKTVPERFRTKEITTTKDEKMKVATIRDVVTWSKTKKNIPDQYEMDFDLPLVSACDIGGYCE